MSITPDWGLELGISTADFAACAFTCDPDSLKTIRRFILTTVSAWGLHALADDLTTVINELTTNAVQHALPSPGNIQPKGWLGIARTGSTVVCAVTDPSPTPPSRRTLFISASRSSTLEGGHQLPHDICPVTESA
ncbi:ATP-binding protein [Streptomyces sp. bgisy027]|uniref:ATP-binding protein n=1 Tax=Streptomyces sp. bgisy027 TaxID=3413770 RepID=UPI003D75AC79